MSAGDHRSVTFRKTSRDANSAKLSGLSLRVTQILDPFSVPRGTQIGRTNRKRIVHADNPRPQPAKITLDFMERNALKSAPCPPYSQDLALSDFDLFGYAKQLLRGYEFTDRTAFLHAIEYILGY
jgi:hypothetical protein